MSLPVIALVGRPNVGKSALFNRIVGRNTAIVSEEAGTTRDRHFAQAEWGGSAFWLVDTGGITDDPRAAMDVEIRRQVQQAIDEADLLLFVVDARAGVHPVDYRIAEILRHSGKPFLVVANKADDPKSTDYFEFFALGAGDPLPVSAVSGKQSGDLLDTIIANIPEVPAEDDTALRIAVIGRPNVGKSSFVNRLLGEDRLEGLLVDLVLQPPYPDVRQVLPVLIVHLDRHLEPHGIEQFEQAGEAHGLAVVGCG